MNKLKKLMKILDEEEDNYQWAEEYENGPVNFERIRQAVNDAFEVENEK